MKNKFAQKLKELRDEHNLSQKKFAQIFEYSQPTIAMWENSTREPGLDTIVEIALYFKVSTDYLLGLED